MIRELAKYLKENVPPGKAARLGVFVKTGPNKDRPPMQEDWWYIRAAAVLRKNLPKWPCRTWQPKDGI